MKRTLVAAACLAAFACAGPEETSPASSTTFAPGEKPVVLVKTSMGDFKVELEPDKAPVTVKNFLTYVDEKFYDGTIFHRVIGLPGGDHDFMIQGGGFLPGMKEKQPHPAIKNEAATSGLSNLKYTIAMARTNDPDSATAQFYINVADNKFLDAGPGKPGYAVFGRVIEGQAVVDKIKSVEVGPRDVPVKDVVIQSIRRIDK